MKKVSHWLLLAAVLFLLEVLFLGASPVGAAEGPTYLRQEDRVSQMAGVEDIVVRGQTVSGRVVNRMSRPIRKVGLTIRSIWLWNNEYKPGVDDLSRATVYRIDGQIPPGGSVPFSFSSLPVASRPDGRYETKVSISEFEEVP